MRDSEQASRQLMWLLIFVFLFFCCVLWRRLSLTLGSVGGGLSDLNLQFHALG
jgi:hypothetical protein